MIEATELRGNAVVALDTAHKIGEVESLYLKPDEQKVVGIRVRSRQYNERLAISSSNIRSIGKDAVTITSSSLLQHPSRLPELAHVPDLEQIQGARVVTESGKLLGQIGNLYIDPDTCQITKYELEGSFWENLTQTKHTFVASKGMQFGTNILIVPDEVEAQLGREPARAGESQGQAMEAPPTPSPERATGAEPEARTPETGPTTQIPAQGPPPSPTGNEARRNELLDEQRRLQQRIEQDRRRLEELQAETRQTMRPGGPQESMQAPPYGPQPEATPQYVSPEGAEARAGLPEMPPEPAPTARRPAGPVEATAPEAAPTTDQQTLDEEQSLKRRIADEQRRLEELRSEGIEGSEPPAGS